MTLAAEHRPQTPGARPNRFCAPPLRLTECNNILRSDARNVKALARRGQAKIGLEDFTGAVADLRKALQLSPEDTAIENSLQQAEKGMRESGQPEVSEWTHQRPLQSARGALWAPRRTAPLPAACRCAGSASREARWGSWRRRRRDHGGRGVFGQRAGCWRSPGIQHRADRPRHAESGRAPAGGGGDAQQSADDAVVHGDALQHDSGADRRDGGVDGADAPRRTAPDAR